MFVIHSSTMAPTDFSCSVSASSAWDIAGHGREEAVGSSLFGAERDRDKSLKKEAWSSDNGPRSYRRASPSSAASSSSSSSSSHSSSFSSSSSSSLPGHSNSNRRASGFAGRHDPVESGRYGLPSESRNDGLSVLGSSFDTEKLMKNIDDIYSRDVLSSPGNSIGPTYDPSPCYGTDNESANIGTREREQLKSISSHFVQRMMHRDLRSRECSGSQSDLCRKVYDFPKLDPTKDWDIEVKGVLEGRIDRYGNAGNREVVLMGAHKDQSQSVCGSRGRTCSSLLSTWMPTYTSSPYLQDVGSFIVRSGASGSISPSLDVCSPTSLKEESNGDEIGGNLKKRPRLTWGQGLAKYEKEKSVEDPSVQKKSDECNHGGDTSGICDISRHCRQNKYVYNHQSHWNDKQADTADATNYNIQCKQWQAPLPQLLSEAKNNEGGQDQSCLTLSKKSIASSSMKELMEAFVEDPSDCTILDSIKASSLTLSKDVLTQYVEKMEFEIDLVEKEIIKLDNEQDFITDYVEKVDLEIDLVEKEIIKLKKKNHTAHICPHGFGMDSSTELPESMFCSISSIQQISPEKVASRYRDTPTKETANPTNNSIECSTDSQQVENELIQEENRANELSIHSFHAPCLMPENNEAAASFDDVNSGNRMSNILLSNKVTALEIAIALSHLHPAYINHTHTEVYRSPQEVEIWKYNSENYEKKKKILAYKINQEKENARFTEGALILKYMAKRELWKFHKIGCSNKNYNIDPCFWSREQQSRKASFQKYPTASGSATVEGDEYLGTKLLGLRPIKKKRELLRMPPMAMRFDKMNLNCFKTKNGLVDDPIAAEQERKILNPWSAEEKKIFLEKYLLFGKNLRKIATFLEYKTVADCVQFYYLNQKSEEFEKIRHKHFFKKQRDLRSSALYLSATTSSSEQCDVDDACLEGLSLVAAAAAAAMSSPAGASEDKVTYLRADKKQASNKQSSSLSTSGNSCSGEQKVSKKSCKWSNRSFRQLYEERQSQWTGEERDLYLKALPMFGKDFHKISLYIGTKSQRQCKSFFSKARKQLDLDQLVEDYMTSIQDAHEGKADLDLKVTFKIDRAIKMEEHQEYHGRVEMFSAVDDEALHKPKRKLEGENISVIDALELLQESSHANINGAKDKNSVSIVDNLMNQCAFGKSLVCEENLQLKTELLKVKKEPRSSSKLNKQPRTGSVVVSHDNSPPSAIGPPPISAGVVSQVKERGSKRTEVRTRREPTSWSQQEKDIFIDVLKTYGKNWERLRESLPAKSLTQIKTYFQNSKAKLSLGFEGMISNANGRASSLKRKADDSGSNTNNSPGVRYVAEKASLISDDGSLKGSLNSFQSNGLDHASSTSCTPSMIYNAPVLGPLSTHNVQPSYMHFPCMIMPSQQPITSLVVVEPSLARVDESCGLQSIAQLDINLMHLPQHVCSTQLLSDQSLSPISQLLHDKSDSELQLKCTPHVPVAVKEAAHNSFDAQNHQIVKCQIMNHLFLTSSQGIVMQFVSEAKRSPVQQFGMCQSEPSGVHSKPLAVPHLTEQGLPLHLMDPQQAYPLGTSCSTLRASFKCQWNSIVIDTNWEE